MKSFCPRLKLLKHFGQMAMMKQSIGPEVFVDLGKMQLIAGLAAGSGYARFGVGDDARAHVHPPSFQQRCQCKDDRGRIAAGIGNQPRLGDLRGVKFRNSIHGFGKRAFCSVVKAVPVRIGCGVPEPERPAEIHDANTTLQQTWNDVVRGFVWSREKNDVRP